MVFAAALWLGVLSPLAGAIAWVAVAPFAMFVLGWSLWWYVKRRTATALLALAVVAAVANWWIFGLAGGPIVTILYSLGSVAVPVAQLAGYAWGARRQRQGWSLQHDASA